jgi:hypothetical protein
MAGTATFGGVPGGVSSTATFGGVPGGVSSIATFGGVPGGVSSTATFGGVPGGVSGPAKAKLATAQEANKAIRLIFITCSKVESEKKP